MACHRNFPRSWNSLRKSRTDPARPPHKHRGKHRANRAIRRAGRAARNLVSMTTSADAADRYASYMRTLREEGAALATFRAMYDFEFDEFQVEACRALAEGHGVLVAAPTGPGKTGIGEFAARLAVTRGRKCFYTTPIKALSNQKYGDLVKRYGPAKVGLLTGDNAVNGDAPVVVMTTEVLRNMLYSN